MSTSQSMADAASEQPVFLHGDLELTIIEGRNLLKKGVYSGSVGPLFTSCVPINRPPDYSGGDHTNPYVTAVVSYASCHAEVARTSVIKNACNPQWNEHFFIPLAHPVVNLAFEVKVKVKVKGARAHLIGTVKIPAVKLAEGEEISRWFPVIGSSSKLDPAIRMEMRFTPCEKNKLYKHGIAGDPEQKGVRNAYFPLRKGNSVSLYQDAHVPDGQLPKIELDGGKVFQHEKCWEDICHAIAEARSVIYIRGWSIFHKIKLVREPTRPLPRGGDLTLGELLNFKSEEGVRVLLLIWDDKTSRDQYLINTEGVMHTHDKETKKFFKHSVVNCELQPRYTTGKIKGFLFTHHQKCVLVDTQASGNNRKITAFVGGLDLCDGRYDTPQHRLLLDLNTVFKDDFHNPTFPAGTKAPRQPWHDLHTRIDGPAAYDVLINFEQCWKKVPKWIDWLHFNSGSNIRDKYLIKIDRISYILSPSMPAQKDSASSSKKDGTLSSKTHTVTVIPDDDSNLRVSKDDESWHVQAGTKAPSKPSHDFHSRIDGPAAHVLINYEQPRKKVKKWTEMLHYMSLFKLRNNSLVKVDPMSSKLSPTMPVQKDSASSSKKDGTLSSKKHTVSSKKHMVTVIPDDDSKLWVSKDDESWHVQILRSIDNGSVKGFPSDVKLAEAQNLICVKNLVIDKSIQNGYIQAIRSAQHFIYIESQYFIGASYGWPDYKNPKAGADNLIPMELALKIASKIRANERFAVYIVIPMWPEGDPESGAVQEILYWQSQTMQMMYDVVARELKSMKRSESPQDYLNFYCLGNREGYSEDVSGADAGKVSDSQKFRRFMIYVHSKGMIVDDEYVIVGSPNINERSMAGTRDTEIAMGSYQPHYTRAKMKKHPRGQVYGYRMSLWTEHLGLKKVEASLIEPESLECVRMVNEIAEDNWRRFTAEEFTTLRGHLLKYPLQVDANGKVSPLPGYENFPDVGGKVIGAHSTALPDVLTT